MYKNIAGQSVYYQTVGKGIPMVLLHGWGHDVSTFWPLIPLLQNQFTLYLVDLPGFGRSDLPKKPLSVADYADIIAKLLEELPIRPIVLGHSLGGQIAIKLAATHPDLVDKLILEDAAAFRKPDTLKKLALRAVAKCFRLLPDSLRLKKRLRHKLYRALQSDYETAGQMKTTIQRVLSEDVTHDAQKITAETLILWGQNDPATPLADGKRLYRLIPSSRIEVFDDVGHFPHLEATERFCSYVKDFA